MLAGPTVEERRHELLKFYAHYEDLVEVICDAAQYGPTPRLEAHYADLRQWMRAGYVSVKPYIMAYLRVAVEDAAACLRMSDSGGDAFEALCAAEDLSEFLREDDGNMIFRITRTREALNLYGEHLRQLEAKG